VGDVVPADKRSTSEYRVYIELSCSFWVYYDLLTQLSPDIAAGVDRSLKGTSLVRIPVKAGQVIGRIGGQTLDVGAIDAGVRLTGFAVPEHYEREPWKIHAVDPTEYYTEPLKSALLAKNVRLAEPRGGKIDHDVAGTLAGNWFLEGTNGYAGTDRARPWAGHLSFIPDYLVPSQLRVSIGTFGGRSRQFGVLGNGPDPRTVGPGSGVVRYTLVPYVYVLEGTGEPWNRDVPPTRRVAATRLEDRVEGVALVEVLDDRRIRFEAFPGARPEGVTGFTARAKVYER
jgi:hypothetical protein